MHFSWNDERQTLLMMWDGELKTTIWYIIELTSKITAEEIGGVQQKKRNDGS
jgi:hypothetical protein